MLTDEEMMAMTKKYAGLWHIENPYDKAIETVKFLRMSCILRDDDFTRGFTDGLKRAEKALQDLKALEESRKPRGS